MTLTPSNIFGDLPTYMSNTDNNQHKRILDNLALAVFLVDEDLCLKYINPSAEEIIGTGVRQAIDRKLTDFFVDTEDRLIKYIRDSMLNGHPMTLREVSMKRLSGDDITIDCSLSPLSTKNEEAICLLEINRVDRLVRISREEHLLSETQATQNMLRGLAHEIKNPLGGLRGAAQLLAHELNSDEMNEYTDVIINEADRLRKLVDRMFGPNITPSKKMLNIHDVLEHIRHLALAETPQGVNFITDYDPSIPEISADRDLLVQAILNIVRNAVRAVDQQGDVTLKTRIYRQHTIGEVMHRLVVAVSVIDSGTGIDEELKSQIFFPMVSGSDEGTGLGLPISQNLVCLHDGLIEFDSVPGNTEFRILLPLNNGNKFKLKN